MSEREVASEGQGELPPGEPSHRTPILLDLATERGRELFDQLVARGSSSVTKLDPIRSQIGELLRARSPGESWSPASLERAIDGFLEERGREIYGRWVFYPWRRTMVRLLPPDEFAELRTSRNRYKITADEQRRLANATIGIVGLSAGNAIALCLALERVGGTFRLADHDAIELSNMNRVFCGVTALGVNKAVLTARQLWETDPYLRVEIFSDGVQQNDVDAFLAGPPMLDLVIEECDDLYMKVRLREEARTRRIPVVMETNDRGLLDVERFDLEPDRPVFHGLLAGTRSDELRDLDTEGKTPFMLRILGTDMSPRLAASLIEIDKTITGWPQLGSGNMLGGAVVTDAVRRMLLDQWRASGRFRVDLEQLITSSAAAVSVAVEARAQPTPVETQPARIQEGPRGRTPAREEIEWLVERAAMAPSGGNDQPWRFVWTRGLELNCYLDRAHSGSFLDYQCSASYLALGAAAENASIAVSSMKRVASVHAFPDHSEPDLVFNLVLSEPVEAVTLDPLRAFIESRATNRHLGERRSLDVQQEGALREAAMERGAVLKLITDPELLTEIGELLGAVDRFRFLCEPLHSAMMGELRWNAEEAMATRDGIDVATLELDAVSMAGLRLLANERTAAFLRSLGQGARLERPARRAIASSCAVGLITIDGTDQRAHFAAGRALQRVWLSSTRLGLAFQPMSVAPYLFLRLTRGKGEGFTSAETASLELLRKRFARIFESVEGRAEPLLFRLTHAPPPSTRSLRRTVAAILTEG